MKPGVTDVTFSTRVTDLPAAWVFVMEKLGEHELLSVQITAQDWKQDEDTEWVETFLVSVEVRLKEAT